MAKTFLAERDKQKCLFPSLALADQDWQPSVSKDILMKEVDVVTR